jgi:hypothetical protein
VSVSALLLFVCSVHAHDRHERAPFLYNKVWQENTPGMFLQLFRKHAQKRKWTDKRIIEKLPRFVEDGDAKTIIETAIEGLMQVGQIGWHKLAETIMALHPRAKTSNNEDGEYKGNATIESCN